MLVSMRSSLWLRYFSLLLITWCRGRGRGRGRVRYFSLLLITWSRGRVRGRARVRFGLGLGSVLLLTW